MVQSYDIFISYSQKDSEIVHKYAEYLEYIGYKVWYDVKGLYGGAKFAGEIAEAIENSRLFVFFSSKYSNSSEWTKGEIFLAHKYKKSILPVRLDDSEYEKSVMIVLLPLHYIVCNNGVQSESKNVLNNAIKKIIGEPTNLSKEITSDEVSQRSYVKQSLCLSVFASVLFSFIMMICSGEYWLNISLSFFAMTVTTIFCFLASLYIIFIDKNWSNRAYVVNIAYLLGVIFFLSYTIMALGLCFVSYEIFELNYPSVICALFTIFALNRLMSFKKYGYLLLWVCAFLFSIGSYWWLAYSFVAPIVIASIACICMLILTIILKKEHNGSSLWNDLKISSRPFSV